MDVQGVKRDGSHGDSRRRHACGAAARLRPLPQTAPLHHNQVDLSSEQAAANAPKISTYRSVVAVVAIVASFVVQLVYDDALLLGAMIGFGVFMATGVVRRREVMRYSTAAYA